MTLKTKMKSMKVLTYYLFFSSSLLFVMNSSAISISKIKYEKKNY